MKCGRGGKLEWTTQIKGEDANFLTGEWELFRVDQEIRVTLDEKDPISGETIIYAFELRKLEETSMWIHFFLNGDEWDVQLGE